MGGDLLIISLVNKSMGISKYHFLEFNSVFLCISYLFGFRLASIFPKSKKKTTVHLKH